MIFVCAEGMSQPKAYRIQTPSQFSLNSMRYLFLLCLLMTMRTTMAVHDPPQCDAVPAKRARHSEPSSPSAPSLQPPTPSPLMKKQGKSTRSVFVRFIDGKSISVPLEDSHNFVFILKCRLAKITGDAWWFLISVYDGDKELENTDGVPNDVVVIYTEWEKITERRFNSIFNNYTLVTCGAKGSQKPEWSILHREDRLAIMVAGDFNQNSANGKHSQIVMLGLYPNMYIFPTDPTDPWLLNHHDLTFNLSIQPDMLCVHNGHPVKFPDDVALEVDLSGNLKSTETDMTAVMPKRPGGNIEFVVPLFGTEVHAQWKIAKLLWEAYMGNDETLLREIILHEDFVHILNHIISPGANDNAVNYTAVNQMLVWFTDVLCDFLVKQTGEVGPILHRIRMIFEGLDKVSDQPKSLPWDLDRELVHKHHRRVLTPILNAGEKPTAVKLDTVTLDNDNEEGSPSPPFLLELMEEGLMGPGSLLIYKSPIGEEKMKLVTLLPPCPCDYDIDYLAPVQGTRTQCISLEYLYVVSCPHEHEVEPSRKRARPLST